jgi:hypothetical protein
MLRWAAGGLAIAVVSSMATSALASQSRPAPAPPGGAAPPSASPPSAASPPSSSTTPSLPSLRTLLKKGYEIVAVTVIAPDVLTAMGNDPKNPQILVSLQKGRKLAACQYYSGNWMSLVANSIEGTSQCSVYPK